MMMSWVDVLSLVMIGQRTAEKLANFLSGDFVVEFDWLVLNMKNLLNKFCGAWSKHQLCQVSR